MTLAGPGGTAGVAEATGPHSSRGWMVGSLSISGPPHSQALGTRTLCVFTLLGGMGGMPGELLGVYHAQRGERLLSRLPTKASA